MAVTSVAVHNVTAGLHCDWLLGPIGPNDNQCRAAPRSSTTYHTLHNASAVTSFPLVPSHKSGSRHFRGAHGMAANCVYISHVNANYPGSVHDAYILRNSIIPYVMGQLQRHRVWLIGDSCYPNLSWLLTPVRNPRTRAEERYNEAHGWTRRIIERTFSLLKARFRCLHLTGGSLYYSLKKVCQIIVACCMLHNLALRRQVPFLLEDEPGDGLVAAVEPVDNEEEEAEEEDVDNRTNIGGHSDPGGQRPPGRRTAGAPPTGRRCSNGDSGRGGKAAVGPAPLAGSRQCTAAPLNPPRRRSLLHRRGDSDPPYRHPDPGGPTAGIRMAVGGVAGPLGAPAVPMPLAWALQGPP
ncbi:hypothetical protein NDU88_003307 [Pleurodeles waltl]|uniref:DDE Tnp4 domain-containing protein n=1 Tax=Pleurodeles waltl TaxID=8319 RepID=A0AAV7NHR0_PLEWA|nr:hypothetical protein NDU88_003307 [Pleurodeles waltl]